jgi:hypothetical protein
MLDMKPNLEWKPEGKMHYSCHLFNKDMEIVYRGVKEMSKYLVREKYAKIK